MVLFWTRSNVQRWLSMMEGTNVNGDEKDLTGWRCMYPTDAIEGYIRPSALMRYITPA